MYSKQCFTRFVKDERKEFLNFIRFCYENGYDVTEDIKAEMINHIASLYGNRGEYSLKTTSGNSYDTEECSLAVRLYAENNNFLKAPEPYDFSCVEEIVVAGHGLESDLEYISSIFEQAKVKEIVLFSYPYESMEEIDRKRKVLNEISGIDVDNIHLDQY